MPGPVVRLTWLARNAFEKRCCRVQGRHKVWQRSMPLDGFHGMLNGRVLGVLCRDS